MKSLQNGKTMSTLAVTTTGGHFQSIQISITVKSHIRDKSINTSLRAGCLLQVPDVIPSLLTDNSPALIGVVISTVAGGTTSLAISTREMCSTGIDTLGANIAHPNTNLPTESTIVQRVKNCENCNHRAPVSHGAATCLFTCRYSTPLEYSSRVGRRATRECEICRKLLIKTQE